MCRHEFGPLDVTEGVPGASEEMRFESVPLRTLNAASRFSIVGRKKEEKVNLSFLTIFYFL